MIVTRSTLLQHRLCHMQHDGRWVVVVEKIETTRGNCGVLYMFSIQQTPLPRRHHHCSFLRQAANTMSSGYLVACQLGRTRIASTYVSTMLNSSGSCQPCMITSCTCTVSRTRLAQRVLTTTCLLFLSLKHSPNKNTHTVMPSSASII